MMPAPQSIPGRVPRFTNRTPGDALRASAVGAGQASKAALVLATAVCVMATVPAPAAEPAPTVVMDGSMWDDGLSEMSYYDATDTIYGQQRRYTRVQLMNRQWMDPESGVKAESDAVGAVGAIKFLVAEEVPTENYNYRYLTSVFLQRADLRPLKATYSSQEWCGSTFKHLRWTDDALTVQSFSYFGDEGDETWQRSEDSVPFEALFVLAREVVASGQSRTVLLLPPLRSNHAIAPDGVEATLELTGDARKVTVPAGRYHAQRVVVRSRSAKGWFDVETASPYRLLAFSAGGVSGQLRGVERRAYWDRSWKSKFHEPGQAP